MIVINKHIAMIKRAMTCKLPRVMIDRPHRISIKETSATSMTIITSLLTLGSNIDSTIFSTNDIAVDLLYENRGTEIILYTLIATRL